VDEAPRRWRFVGAAASERQRVVNVKRYVPTDRWGDELGCRRPAPHSHRLHIRNLKLHRGRPAEEADGNAEAIVRQDRFHDGREAGEGAISDNHALAYLDADRFDDLSERQDVDEPLQAFGVKASRHENRTRNVPLHRTVLDGRDVRVSSVVRREPMVVRRRINNLDSVSSQSAARF